MHGLRIGVTSFVLAAVAAGGVATWQARRSDVLEPVALRGAWQQVWVDDFDGSTVDPTRWRPEPNRRYGEGNGELACLTDRPENLRVVDGTLLLIARREPYDCGPGDTRFPQGRAYTSAMLTTKATASWTYGRFEVRAKLPTVPGRSQGLWPAFWLRPVDAGNGELDVLETVGSDDPTAAPVFSQTLIYDYRRTHPHEKGEFTFPDGVRPWEDFHTYAVEWDPGIIRWYVDGTETYRRTRASTEWLDETSSRPYFLRLNLAVGGSFPGDPGESTLFPAAFVVDRVAVFTRMAEPTPSASPPG